MRSFSCLALFASLLLHVPDAAAADAGIFQLAYFEGPWVCEGTAWDLKTGAATPVTGTWEFTYDCSHRMMTDKFVTNDPNAPFTVWGFNSYDDAGQTLVRRETDSNGTWAESSAGGWADNVIVWRGAMNTVAYGPYSVTNTITQMSDTRFWVDFIARPDGHARWFDAFKGNCRRDRPWGR